jgi:hypothetical protein
VHPPPNAQQQRDEQLRKDETRREENERRILESELRAFDAHRFYETLEQWTAILVPKQVPHTVHVTPFRQKVIMTQPLPISRRDLNDMRKLSYDCSRLIGLLRAIDQKGVEYPYIHLAYRTLLECAIAKCVQLHAARELYSRTVRGFWNQLGRLLNLSFLDAARKDIETFRQRLEALLMMSRQQGFVEDLVRLRRSVTYRTGALLDQQELVAAQPKSNASPVPRQRQTPRAQPGSRG